MSAARRSGRIGVIVALVWVLAGIPSGSSAQSSSGLGGFAMGATGSAVSMIYVDPGSPIPASPTGEMHAAYTLAEVEFGPSGHGVAAELWPGETAATVPPFLEQTFWDEFERGFRENDEEPPFTNPNVVPRWPLAAETFEPQGPNEQAVPPNAESTAKGEFAFSKANTTPLSLPGLLEVDSGSSTSLAKTGDIERDDGSEVTGAISDVKASAGDISILGGFVSIEEVVTTARVTSDAEVARVTGRTTVSGLKIDGQGFVIDADGIHADGETHDDFNPVLGQLREGGETALADQGITMTLAQPIDTVDGAQGSRTLGGLIVRMDSRRLDDLVSSLPEAIQHEIRSQASTDHTFTLIFGSVAASASAAPEFTFEAPAFDFSAPPQVLSSGATSDAASTANLNATPLPEVSPAPSGEVTPAQPAFAAPVEVDGIGAGVALMAIALVLAAARGLHWMSGALLAGGATDDCKS